MFLDINVTENQRGKSRMDTPETLATLGTQATETRQTKQTITHHNTEK